MTTKTRVKKRVKKQKGKGKPRHVKSIVVGGKEVQQEVLPPHITPNGIRIYRAMSENGVKGSWKDWVLFVGDMMVERYGTFQVKRLGGPPPSDGTPTGQPSTSVDAPTGQPTEVPTVQPNAPDASKLSKPVLLVHKSKLPLILGERFGGMFWDSRRQRRVNHGAPPASKSADAPRPGIEVIEVTAP